MIVGAVLIIGAGFLDWEAIFFGEAINYEESDRNYFKLGTIYAWKDDPKKEYSIIAIATAHFTTKQMKNMIFFDSAAEAEAAGYKSDEYFKKYYPCLLKGMDWFKCDKAERDLRTR